MIIAMIFIIAAVCVWGAYGIGRARQWRDDITCMDFDELRDVIDSAEDVAGAVWDYHFQQMFEVSPKDCSRPKHER